MNINEKSVTEQVDEDISEALNEDQHFIGLDEEEKKIVLDRLNQMLHHTLYRV